IHLFIEFVPEALVQPTKTSKTLVLYKTVLAHHEFHNGFRREGHVGVGPYGTQGHIRRLGVPYLGNETYLMRAPTPIHPGNWQLGRCNLLRDIICTSSDYCMVVAVNMPNVHWNG